MNSFETITFQIPELKGISSKTIEEHLKLYAGYVKHSNLILEHINTLATSPDGGAEKYAYELGEIQRRFSFEFNGMRNHEYYFRSLEDGPSPLEASSKLKKAIENEWGDFDLWLNRFKSIALTRGIGWAILYYDPQTERLLNAWVDEQHLGQLSSCKPIIALDMWEHSFVADYQPSGKKQYVEDYFANLNWTVAENNFKGATS